MFMGSGLHDNTFSPLLFRAEALKIPLKRRILKMEILMIILTPYSTKLKVIISRSTSIEF